MSLLVWIMIGIAVWHFMIFMPDRFLGGIVGAFGAAIAGAVIFSLIVNGFGVPGRDETGIEQAFYAIPGSLIGLAAAYYFGNRAEQAAQQS